MYTYGKDYIMGLMKKQGELSPVPDKALHREKVDPKNKFDPAVFKMADQKDY